VRAADEPQSILKGAMQQLLQGANTSDSETFSTIPRQTALLGLRVESDGVHVNLSQEYTSGGGSASMKGRLAQVIYTATSLDPNTSVWIDVEGKPLEVLGGEGVTVSQPMTRQEFDQNFPL
jgi:spore germination protein GerM